MKRSNPYAWSPSPRELQRRRLLAGTFIGPVRSTAMYNRQVARQRLAIRGFKPGYNRTGGLYGRFGRAAIQNGMVPELKFFDTALNILIDASAEVSTTAATGAIALIPQGDTASTRDGRVCHIQSIHLKGVLVHTPGIAATASGVVYLYLMLDKQANGALPTGASDVVTSTSLSTSFMALENSSRFQVLKKWVVAINPMAGASTSLNSTTKNLDYFKKCNIEMQYSSTTGAITEIKSNNVFMMFGASGVAIDDTVVFNGNARLRFRG